MKLIKDLSIRRKIFGSIIAIITLLIGIGAFFTQLRYTYERKASDARHIAKSMLSVRLNERDFLIKKDISYAVKTHKSIKDVSEHIKDFKGTVLGDSLQQVADQFGETFNDIVEVIKKKNGEENFSIDNKLKNNIFAIREILLKSKANILLFDLFNTKKSENDFRLTGDEKYFLKAKISIDSLLFHSKENKFSDATDNELNQLSNNYLIALNLLAKNLWQEQQLVLRIENITLKFEPLVNSIIEQAEADEKYYARLRIMAILLMIVLGLFLSYRLTKTISTPIIALQEISEQFINGNYNVSVEVDSNDEIGMLGKSFNKMATKIGMQIGYLDNIPAPVLIVDKEFNIKYINYEGGKIIGAEPKSLVGKKCYDQFKAGDCKTENCSIAQAMKKDDTFTRETIARPNGKEISIMYTGKPIKDKEGNIIGALEYIADISQIKEREDYLRRNTNVIVDAMRKFAEGDLTIEITSEIEDDSFAELFNNFNKTVSNIKQMIYQLMDAIEATSKASTEISVSTNEMATGSKEQNSQTAEVVIAVDKIVESIFRTNTDAKEATKIVTEALKIIEDLGSSSKRIGQITQVINDISDKTNLLALNAAIEAARAGEYGRGFAVVADEVRKLAENTSDATTEIKQMIDEMQSFTNQAISVMQKSEKESKYDFGTEKDSVMDVVGKVANSSLEQSKSAEQIKTNINIINNVTQKSSENIQSMVLATEDLFALTNNLTDIIGQFTTEDNFTEIQRFDENKIEEFV